MVGKWAVVLPLLVTLKNVLSQPITEQNNIREVRQLSLGECCPCPEAERSHGGLRANVDISSGFAEPRGDCPCQDRAGDPDASASMLLPALRAIQPFMKQAEEKPDPKPLLQPEVGLASSVLETLREATDEEYQEALARDAARSAVKLIESDLSAFGDALTETPKNVVRIFLNPKEDDMDDNLPEPSHVQETRCIHSPLESIHNMGQLRMNRPTPLIEVFDTPRRPIKHKNKPSTDVLDTPSRPLKLTNTKSFDVIETPRRPVKKINNRGLLHRSRNDMDNSVGASNVQERVVEAGANAEVLKENSLNQNSGLFNLFSNHKLKNSDDFQEIDGLGAIPGKIKKSEPKINLKLKNLIDDLHNKSNTGKLKLPVIDLKKYFESTTKLPALKFKPLENPLFRENRPLQLKDLLKLKDVDVFSHSDVTNFAATSEKPHLQSQKLKIPDSNCKDDMITNKNNRKELADEASEHLDSIISPTYLNPVYNQGNIKLLNENNNEGNQIPEESIDNSSKSSPSIPEDNETVAISDIKSEECSIENSQESPQNNLSETESIPECLIPNNENDTPKITSHLKIDNDENKIELVEEDLPIIFDDSSFRPEIQSTDTKSEQSAGESINVLHDPIADSSNVFNFDEQSNEETASPQLSFENVDTDCNNRNIERAIPSSTEDKNVEDTFKQDEFDEDIAHKDLKDTKNIMNSESITKSEKKTFNTVKDTQSNEISDISSVSLDTNTSSEPKDKSREVTYKDLQEMSNSILNLSECSSPSVEEENTNIENTRNSNVIEKQYDSFEIPDAELNLSLVSGEDTGEVLEEINKDGDENETRNNHIKMTENAIDNEMAVEASEPDSNCVVLSGSEAATSDVLIPVHVDDDNIPKVGTKQAKDTNTILQVDKHTKIINGLKKKIGDLFSTTEIIPQEDGLTNSEDNVNESSNNNPTIAYLNDPKSINKLGRKLPTRLRDTLDSEIPGLSLNSFKNKLPVPKNLDKIINLDPALNSRIAQLSSPILGKQPQKELKLQKSRTLTSIDNFRPSNAQNNIESPFDLNPPFEDIIFGPGSTLNNLSDRLRSHTENTIQNIKETFESRLKDAQSSGLRVPTNTIKSEDILDTISSRRNELNEKLQAIHADINDRFSTFQQGILDQLNAASVRNSELDQESNNKRLEASKSTLQVPLQDTFNFKSITSKQNPKSVIPHSTTFSEEKDNIFKLNKFLNIPKKADRMPHLGNSKISDLKPEKQPRILLERNNYQNTKEPLPTKTLFGLKSSLHKPSINTSAPLIPRPKYFKTKIDIGPGPGVDPEMKATKNKPLLIKSKHNVNLPEEPENSPSSMLPARINRLGNNNSDKKENVFTEDSSTDSPLEKLKKSLLRRNQELKSLHKTKTLSLPSASLNSDEDVNAKEDKVLSRLREGRTRLGSKTENVLTTNDQYDHAISDPYLDASHSAAQNVERVKIVEPLQENVPYKCKLICYKDV